MRANHYVARMGDDDWDRAVEMLGRLPAELTTPMLRGDILSLPRHLGPVAREPRAAWRVLRPFVLGGNVVGGSKPA
jgi:hypothetical protein